MTSLQELETAINLNGEIVVSKNSKNNVILMSMEEYEKKIIKEKVEKNLLKAEEDIANGKLVDANKVFNEWSTKYGI